MIYPYMEGSKGAKALAEAIGTKVIRTKGSKFKGDHSKVIINWGSSNLPDEVNKCHVINKASALKKATNKRLFFEAVEGKLQIPEFTVDRDVAHGWLEDGGTVVVRTTLTGHSAEGLYIIESETDWKNFDLSLAKLFVKYIPKKYEYRVHVVGDEVVDVQRKAASKEVPAHHLNWKVRNLNNGFIFMREGVEDNLSPQVKDQAIKAVKLVGLDFGAVDIIFNVYHNMAYVLEVNAAPGLEGSTPASYKKGFEKLFAALEPDKYAAYVNKAYLMPEANVSLAVMGKYLKGKKAKPAVMNEAQDDWPGPAGIEWE